MTGDRAAEEMTVETTGTQGTDGRGAAADHQFVTSLGIATENETGTLTEDEGCILYNVRKACHIYSNHNTCAQ